VALPRKSNTEDKLTSDRTAIWCIFNSPIDIEK
jgi:hypothetical protein